MSGSVAGALERCLEELRRRRSMSLVARVGREIRRRDRERRRRRERPRVSRCVLLAVAVVCCGCGTSGHAAGVRPVVRCEREWASAISRAHGDVRAARALFSDYRRCGAIGG